MSLRVKLRMMAIEQTHNLTFTLVNEEFRFHAKPNDTHSDSMVPSMSTWVRPRRASLLPSSKSKQASLSIQTSSCRLSMNIFYPFIFKDRWHSRTILTFSFAFLLHYVDWRSKARAIFMSITSYSWKFKRVDRFQRDWERFSTSIDVPFSRK